MFKQLLKMISRRDNESIHGIRPANLPRKIRFHVESPTEEFRVLKLGGEEEYLSRFISELLPSDVVWDIGASIGLFGISAAVSVPEGMVISFEPDPEIAARLRANIGLNDLNNIRVIECAVSDKRENVTLFTDGVHGFSPTMRKQSRPGAASGQAVVQCDTLDNMRDAGQIPVPTVMKIDIEGAECLALRGMQGTLLLPDRPRVIFLEMHPVFLESFGFSAQDCESILNDAGYIVEHRVDRDNESLLVFRDARSIRPQPFES